MAVRVGALPTAVRRLPREHGFWVMLIGSLLGSLLRVGVTAATLVATASVFVFAVGGAALSARRIRRSGALQLASTLVLAVSGAPVEAAAGAVFATLVASACVKAEVFVSSVLVVRAALASAGKRSASRSVGLHVAAVALPAAGVAAFSWAGLAAEATACAITATALLALAIHRPTPKALKTLGLCTSGLTLLAALTPLLP